MGEQALKFFGQLYCVERELGNRDAEDRREARQQRSRPVADALHQWLVQQRRKVPDGSATARAIDYSLNRWAALTRFVDDGELPIDNNWVENQIRLIALGRQNWLFAGSLRAGQRAAAIMSLIHSVRLNGHNPYAYMRDVLERLPTQPASRNRGTAAASLEAIQQPIGPQPMKNIEALIADGGDITLGALPPFECAATAADGHNSLAMLVRREGESLTALLKRLDRAIGLAWSDETFIDEVNDGRSPLL